MRRVVMAVCLMLIIVGYSTLAVVCLDRWRDSLTDSLDEIMMHNENGDLGKASEAAEQLSEKWIGLEKKMSVFVSDDKLSGISSTVAKIPHFITEANDELDAEIENVSRQLNLLYRGELPMWYNLL